MRRRALASLAMCSLLLTAGCLAGGAGPLHPPSGPADEHVTTRQPGSGPGGDGAGPGDTDVTTVGSPTNVAVVNQSITESSLGQVVLALTVRNNGSERVRAQLVGTITTNGSRKQAWKQVVLDPGQTRTVEIYFDVRWASVDGNQTEARVVWTRPAASGG